MTPEQTAVLRQLHDEGYAICIFTPEELEGAKPHYIEDAMCEVGWEQITIWAPTDPDYDRKL